MPLTANLLCLMTAAWIVLTANQSFWSLVFTAQGASAATGLFAASLAVALTGLNLFVLRLLSPGRSIRWVLSVLLLVTAITSWFMDTYGVGIDSEMLRNAVQTDPAEASAFLGWPLLWRVLWQAGLPMLVIWRVSMPSLTWLQTLRQYVVGTVLGLVLLFGAALPVYVSYASFFRNNHLAEHLIVPGNVIRAGVKLVRKQLHTNVPYVTVGEDAKRVTAMHDKPLLTLVVVGETARAANFSLGGYRRDTNPMLRQRKVLYFSNVHSCGTATAMSVPCMFSDLPREEFDLNAADRRDTVLDILQRAGLNVLWLDNQSGCKGVCDRVPNEHADHYNPLLCKDGECLDDLLWLALDDKLPKLTGDSVLLMHQMGSHGPGYYRRVPDDHVVFKPTCATEHIETCSTEQIVNAYDNTIAYTDVILAGLIDRLQKVQDKVDSVLLYVSDHGESLGEEGLYLHGQPYALAPEVQKHVPMVMWLSSGAPARLNLDLQCLQRRQDAALSHDNISHTLLGLNDVTTQAYRPALDFLKGCRTQ